MVFSTFKINNSLCNVVFTGPNYFVYNFHAGLIATATRSNDNEKHFFCSVDDSYFNANLIYKNLCAIISNSESKYIKTVCSFDFNIEPVNSLYYLNIQLCKR